MTSGRPFFLLVSLENERPSRFPRRAKPEPGQLGRADLPSLDPGCRDHKHPCSLGGPGSHQCSERSKSIRGQRLEKARLFVFIGVVKKECRENVKLYPEAGEPHSPRIITTVLSVSNAWEMKARGEGQDFTIWTGF